jgi:hypothetical protein
MIAFEISVNGEKACVAGGNNFVYSAIISRVDDATELVDFNVTGMLDENGTPKYLRWNTPAIQLGDEVTIRIVETNSPDPPRPI